MVASAPPELAAITLRVAHHVTNGQNLMRVAHVAKPVYEFLMTNLAQLI